MPSRKDQRSLPLLTWREDREQRERVRKAHEGSPAMWWWRFRMTWRELGEHYYREQGELYLRYPTTCLSCEGTGCPECPPDELRALANRNQVIWGSAENPDQLDRERAFRLWLKRERGELSGDGPGEGGNPGRGSRRAAPRAKKPPGAIRKRKRGA